MKQHYKLAVLLIALTCALSACLDCGKTPVPAPLPLYNNLNQRKLLTSLKNNGVQVIHRGEHTRILLAADYVFPINSVKVKPEATFLLHKIARLIKTYPHSALVLVTASTDNVGSRAAKQARSIRQARNVAAYLWRYGVPHEAVKIIGWADKRPISTMSTVEGQAHNRRVEIEIW